MLMSSNQSNWHYVFIGLAAGFLISILLAFATNPGGSDGMGHLIFFIFIIVPIGTIIGGVLGGIFRVLCSIFRKVERD